MVAKWSESTHDAFMWRMSGINQKISCGDALIANGWFLGDSGYPLCPNLLTPLLSPETPSETRYNRAFLRTRKRSNAHLASGKVDEDLWTWLEDHYVQFRKILSTSGSNDGITLYLYPTWLAMGDRIAFWSWNGWSDLTLRSYY